MSASAVAHRRRVLGTAAGAVFANFLSLLGMTPLYPVIAHDLGVGPDGFGVYFAFQGTVNVLLQIPVGVVADRIGRARVMTIGLLLIATGQVILSQAHASLAFGLGLVFIGLGGPFIVASSYAAVADAYHGHGRAQALGGLQAAISIGQGTGFVMAGLLAGPLGWRGYCLCVAAVPLLLLPLTASQSERPMREAGSVRKAMLTAARFLANPVAGSLAAVAALNLGAGVGATYLLPFIAHQHGFDARSTSLLLVPNLLGSSLGGPLIGRWADRSGLRGPALASAGVAIVALLAFGWFPFSLPVVVACYLLIGAAVSSLLTLTALAMVEFAGRRRQGTGSALGGLRVGQGLGPASAPALAGLVFVHSGRGIAFATLALVMAAAGTLIFSASRRLGDAD